MSRRKQSNPKPIKHEEEEETMDKRGQDEHQPGDDSVREENDKEPSLTGDGRSDVITDHMNTEDGMVIKTEMDSDIENRSGSEEENYNSHRRPASADANRSPILSMNAGTLEGDRPISDSRSHDYEKEGTRSAYNHVNNESGLLRDIKREPSASPTPEEKSDADVMANQSNGSSISNGPMKARRRNRSRSRSSSKSVGVANSPDGSSAANPTREEAERALVNQLQLPSDVLYLKQQEMSIHGTPSVGWVVCCAIPLPQGSSLGPFQGQLVSPEAVKVGDLIVQFTNRKNQQALMNVAGQSGGWLALLRSAGSSSEWNTHVYWEGNRIWCEIISDIEIGTELRATFSFQHEDEIDDEENEEEEAMAVDVKDSEGSSNDDVSGGSGSLQQPQHPLPQPSHPHQQQPSPGHAALIYGCPFCGVRFSSPRTLQGHLSFYCSKKTSDCIVNPSGKEREKGNNHAKQPPEDTQMKKEPSQPAEKEGTPLKQRDKDNSLPPEARHTPPQVTTAKVGRPGQVFKCQHCSYKADKLSSLNRHMRMHSVEKPRPVHFPLEEVRAASNTAAVSVVKSPSSETFCKECKIQFSSIHTYKCHKEHYCAQRRKKALADPSAFAAMFHSPFSFPDTAKVGIPSALQMAALSQGGLILPGAPGGSTVPGTTAVILSAPVLTANGMANIAISLPTMLMQPMVAGQDAVSALTSSRVSSSPGHTASSSSSFSKRSPQPTPTPLAHFLSPSTTSQSDYTRALGELHKAKDFKSSVKSEPGDEDHPLDLTMGKKDVKPEPASSPPEGISNSLFLQPDKDGALDARRVIRPQSQTSTASSESLPHSRDLKDNSHSPPGHLRHSSSWSEQDAMRDTSSSSSGPARQHAGRSDNIPSSAMSSQLLPHSPLIVQPTGFLPMPITVSPPSKRPTAMSPSFTANGISKCGDCNIVFYKHDNYLIHKKHYCSGKRRIGPPPLGATADSLPVEPIPTTPVDLPRPPSEPQAMPKRDPEKETVPSDEPSTSRPAETVVSPPKHSAGEVKYKFYCVPCRIKFSNASILEAHKEYYCPAGKDSEQSVILQTSSHESVPISSPRDDTGHRSPESPQDEFVCTRCNSIFTSARLLRLHVCDGGFPCPHCDHVSITENRLAEHMKVHAPTRAYRCTICGYRGNTARGMRMHGKTHIDEGLDFTDENMLEYHEPPLVPVINSPHPGSATDSELLRLKNEPYKRRRSRKAYEKFDYPLPKVDIPQTCSLCGQNFANAEFMASHFKVHEIAASQYMAGLMKCLHCDYVGKSPVDLRSHFESNHSGNHRVKKPRLSSSIRGEDSHSGNSNDRPSPQPDLQENDPGERIMVVTNPNSPLDDKDFGYDSPQEHSNHISDNYLSRRSTSPVVKIKDEPMEADEHDGMSTNKVNHFLQLPQPSPESKSPSLSEERMSSAKSPTSSALWRSQATVTISRQPEHAARYRHGSGDPSSYSASGSEMSAGNEPGEISTVRVKMEPTAEDDPSVDARHSPPNIKMEIDEVRRDDYNDEHSRQERSSSAKVQSSERSSPHETRAEAESYSRDIQERMVRTSQASESRTKSPSNRQSPAARFNGDAEEVSLTTPNFLVSSPQQRKATASPSISTVAGLIKQSTSPVPFQPMEVPPLPPHPLPASAIPFPYPAAHLAVPYLFLPHQQPGMVVTASPRSPGMREDRSAGTRYCQNCDISFSKHATYLAHKKYYCTARPRGEAQPSAKA